MHDYWPNIIALAAVRNDVTGFLIDCGLHTRSMAASVSSRQLPLRSIVAPLGYPMFWSHQPAGSRLSLKNLKMMGAGRERAICETYVHDGDQ